ncbi:MAG: SAM-dependent methyltransferase [Thermoprotei archaeon]|nr:MAG: SAM-dependent methyltransferase [Thermoprotei archaeon]
MNIYKYYQVIFIDMKSFDVRSRLEYIFLRLRDRIGIPFKPEEEVKKLDIKQGQVILDFGCGIGSYTIPVAKLVGERGKVYALDRQPFALKKVKERAEKEGLQNIYTILSDGDTGLPDESIDIILLYGVLPEIEDKDFVLRELYRVLKTSGYLSTRYCFRMKRDRILEIMNTTNLYSLVEQKDHILNFKKK